MAFPLQFKFIGHYFYFHFLFETLAFLVGIRLYYFLKKKEAQPFISDVDRLFIMLGAMLGALIGSRLIAILETPHLLLNISFSRLYQSKTIVGGLLGGLLGVELTKKIIGVSVSSGDLYVFPILVALIVGRIGCFSMGIAEPTFGIETNFFTGMNLGDGKYRHPVMLYEITFLSALILFFYSIKNMNLTNGVRFKIFMLAYFTFRFFIEFIKPREPLLASLTIIQWCGIFIWLYYAVLWFLKKDIRTVKVA